MSATATVVARQQVTDTAVLLTLRPRRFVPAPPGSHLDIGLMMNGKRAMRSYSVVELGRRDGTYCLCVQAHPRSRGGSRAMHALAPGDEVAISAPVDGFPPVPGRAPALLLAAGIGITPLIGIADALRGRGVDYRLVCVVRRAALLPLADYLSARHGPRLTVYETEERGRPDVGRLLDGVADGGAAYVCGPLALLEAARAAWARAGRPRGSFRCETFGNSGHRPETDFRVSVRGRPDPVTVAADTSMLDALRAAGEDILFDCRRGECGLCAVDIVDVRGELDHRDVFFSPGQHRDGRKMCACVSRVFGGSVTVDIGRLR